MFFLNSFSDFALDVVGFLAILGEGSIQANAHIISLSYLCYVPRLLPAPQALLPAQRELSLRTRPAYVTGVSSGNMITGVNHVADVLIDADDMEPFEVRCVSVSRNNDRIAVRANPLGPMLFVTMLGCGSSIGLLVASAVLNDGMSLVATVLLSFLSTLTGIANKWAFEEPEKPRDSYIPPANLVVRYPNGSFLVVYCDEITARELYFTRKDLAVKLRRRSIYRTISLFGTMLLMFGVIFLANAQQVMQISWAAVFVLLNSAYWIVAALPKRIHWDLSRFHVVEHGLQNRPPRNDKFTDALWQAIVFAREIEWAKIGEAAAPRTPAWDLWLQKAKEVALAYPPVTGVPADEYTDLKWKWPFAVGFSGTVFQQPPIPEWNPRAELGKAMAHFRTPSATSATPATSATSEKEPSAKATQTP